MLLGSMRIILNGAMQHAKCNMISGESFFFQFYITALFLFVAFRNIFKSWVNDVYTVSKFVITNSGAKLIDNNDNGTFLIK